MQFLSHTIFFLSKYASSDSSAWENYAVPPKVNFDANGRKQGHIGSAAAYAILKNSVDMASPFTQCH